MTHSTVQNCLLVGDIGATKTSLALYPKGKELTKFLAATTYYNDTATNFEEIIVKFLHDNDIRPDAACFGVAGPVSENRVKMTNLDWTLDGLSLQKQLNIRSVTLVNDLVATAMGAVHLPTESLLTINEGQPDLAGTIGVIAPGTGLGESFLINHRNNWLPIPSEGGHSSFAPRGEQQVRLLRFLSKQHNHVSTEMVCSGRGIPNLYDFLCAENGTKDHLNNHPDRTRSIVEKALAGLDTDQPQSIAMQTMQLFIAILAAEAANLSLKILATGGIYIAGGIPPRILPFLQPKEFMNSFARGDYREMLAAIPVHVILEPKTALIGAAACGREHLTASGDTT